MDKRQQTINKKHYDAIIEGHKKGLVYKYPDILFDYLRPYVLGGVPASITLFVNELCNGKCYDRAELMSLAFDDAIIVHGDVKGLKELDSESNPEHAFVITKEFGSNKEWVVDTSVGLIFDKDYYYKIEEVKENKRFLKQDIMKFGGEIKSAIAGSFNFENDKFVLPLVLPKIEKVVKTSNHIGTVMYRDKILQEIELFKEKINYSAIEKEIEEDIQLMHRNPKKLDEKFGIVRDEHGFEISRNGVPNPYYISFEDRNKIQAEYDKIKDDQKALAKFYAKFKNKGQKDIKREEKLLKQRVAQRWEEIKEDPTQNFYE